jgi:purine-nucleoside phosphorylase
MNCPTSQTPGLFVRMTNARPFIPSTASTEPVRNALFPDGTIPRVGCVLGSGLGVAADRLLHSGGRALAWQDIPEMPVPAVAGHFGRFVGGTIEDVPVVLQQGRVHMYEGHGHDSLVAGVRLMIRLGIRAVVITNAAGGIRSGFQPGDLMLIRDHIRWPGAFIAGMSGLSDVRSNSHRCTWPESLRRITSLIKTPLRVHSGVYAMMPGPNYETPAEIRAARTLGADAVGMSTVPEAVEAARLGIPALGISCITNIAAGLSQKTLSHDDVTSTADAVKQPFADWLFAVLVSIGATSECR